MALNKQTNLNKKAVLATLNEILELELASAVRYTQYSFMIFGHSRIPIVSWMRDQAAQSVTHAHEAGDLITAHGGTPSLRIGDLLKAHSKSIDAMLREILAHENSGAALYHKLLSQVENRHVPLEEYARRMIHDETHDIGEIAKMLRRMGR